MMLSATLCISLLLTILFLFLGIVCVGVGVSGSNASGESAEIFFNLSKLSGGIFAASSIYGIVRAFNCIIQKRKREHARRVN